MHHSELAGLQLPWPNSIRVRSWPDPPQGLDLFSISDLSGLRCSRGTRTAESVWDGTVGPWSSWSCSLHLIVLLYVQSGDAVHCPGITLEGYWGCGGNGKRDAVGLDGHFLEGW